MFSYDYEFVPRPAINEVFAELLAGDDKKEAFLCRLKESLRDSPRVSGEPIRKRQSPFYGKRYLDFMDEYIGFCRIVYDVLGRRVVVYAVIPLS